MLPGKLGPIIPGEPIFGKRNESDMLGMIIVEWRKCLISSRFSIREMAGYSGVYLNWRSIIFALHAFGKFFCKHILLEFFWFRGHRSGILIDIIPMKNGDGWSDVKFNIDREERLFDIMKRKHFIFQNSLD